MSHVLRYTLLENLRSRFYLSAIGLLVLILGISVLGSQINYNLNQMWLSVYSFGMGFTKLVIVALTLFLPVFNMSLEHERGTAPVLWAKIQYRSSYYLGKYFFGQRSSESLPVFQSTFKN